MVENSENINPKNSEEVELLGKLVKFPDGREIWMVREDNHYIIKFLKVENDKPIVTWLKLSPEAMQAICDLYLGLGDF